MKRLYCIDVLKFVMAVIIVLHHYQQVTGYNSTRFNFYGGELYYGYVVEFFFIISGFLWWLHLKKMKEQSFVEYFINKSIRIYPMAIFSIVVASIICFFYYSLYSEWITKTPITCWKILNNCLLIFSGGAIDDGLGINNPLWYICILLICYCIGYFIIWLDEERSYNKNVCFVILIFVGLGVLQYGINLPFLNSNSARGYSSFFCGPILGTIWEKLSSKMRWFSFFLSLCIIVGIMLGWSYDRSLVLTNQRETLTYIVFPSVLFIILQINNYFDFEIIKRLHIGEVSFELYLWHCILLYILLFIERERGESIAVNDMNMMLFLIITIVFSYIMLLCFEKPLIKVLKNRLHLYKTI